MNFSSFGGNTTVKIDLSHSNLNIRIPEVRLDMHDKISSIKDLCEKRFGTTTANMRLVLQDTNGNAVATLSDDNSTLGYYSPQDHYCIHVVDLDPNSAARAKELEDVSQIDKYEMSEADYDKLPNSVRKFKERLAQTHPEFASKPKEEKDEAFLAGEASSFEVGKRVRLNESGHRGEVKFIGLVPELDQGWWIGIKLDEPFGKNDGSAKGVKYFDCPPSFGMFVRPTKCQQGDFPEIGLDDEFDDDEL